MDAADHLPSQSGLLHVVAIWTARNRYFLNRWLFSKSLFFTKDPAGRILLSKTPLHFDNLQILPLDVFVQS